MRITQKGQVTIPKYIRDAVGLLPETEASFELVEDGALIRPAPSQSPQERVAAWLRSAPRPTMTGDELMRLTRYED